jgi:Co/Zn/Cd efflux system component
MLADAGALGLALVAQRVAARPRTSNLTYGSRRAETLAAFVNAIVLCVTSIWVMVEAAERWKDPPEIQGRGCWRWRWGAWPSTWWPRASCPRTGTATTPT